MLTPRDKALILAAIGLFVIFAGLAIFKNEKRAQEPAIVPQNAPSTDTTTVYPSNGKE